MKIQTTLSAAFVAMVFFFAPSFATAQTDGCPAHAHLQTEIRACSASGVDFDCACACDRGYHAVGDLANGGRCERDEPIYGTYAEPLCGFGSTRVDGECVCTGPELGARTGLGLLTYPVGVVRTLVEAGRIEDPSGLISQARLARMERRGDYLAVRVCIDPLATGSSSRATTDGYAEALRILCTGPNAAADAELNQLCTDTRALIDSIGPRTTIHYGDRDYTFNEFVTGVLAPLFGEIQSRLGALEGRVEALENEVHNDIVPRIEALESRSDAWATFLNVTHLRLGGFGRVGFSTAGEATGAGGASLELLFRFGTAPVGLFLRGEFGGQATGMDVGSSMYLAGGAGLAYFTGGRRDTTISLGLFAEDLLEPFADGPNEVQGSHLGVVVGGELALSIPLPGDAYWVRIRPGFAIGYSERYFMANGMFGTGTGAYFAPSLGIEFQPDL